MENRFNFAAKNLIAMDQYIQLFMLKNRELQEIEAIWNAYETRNLIL